MERVRKPLLGVKNHTAHGPLPWTSDTFDASEALNSSIAPQLQPGRDADLRQGTTTSAAHDAAHVPTSSGGMHAVAGDGGEVATQRVDPAETAFEELSVDGDSLRDSVDDQMKRTSPAVFCNPLWLSS